MKLTTTFCSLCALLIPLATISADDQQGVQASLADDQQGVQASPKILPNIVIILADDMGYGEVQHLNPKRGKIKTPALDQIAKSGMVFTDAHSGSSVCTPTRYGLMTGRYAWRTRLQTGVLKGGASLIAKETLTIAEMLKTKGYDSVMIGKWHLGMMFDGKQNDKKGAVKPGAKVTHGPLDAAGF
ncbi:MAG: sulfatase-like hydrolase/transferase, partial [Akkermansiaceae bacterium]